MTVTTGWHNPDKTITICIIEGRWDFNDYLKGLKQAAALIATVDHPVDIIMDFSRADDIIPPNPLVNLPKAQDIGPSNRRYIVLAAIKNHIVRAAADIFSKLDPQVYCVHSVEEAFALLVQQRPKPVYDGDFLSGLLPDAGEDS